jgi:serine phosphatase RsbU (regulator of sigma subunit)
LLQLDRSTSEAWSVDAAIAVLETHALGHEDGTDATPATLRHAATVVRESIRGFESMQSELTSALIASQDRILAMKSLAQINVQGIASYQTIGALLDTALALTGSRLVLLLDDDRVTALAGDTADLEANKAVALRAITDAPADLFRSAVADSAMMCTLDPDGNAERYVAFFRGADRPFSTTDMPLLESVVSALGVMLAFTELHERELRQAAVERDHDLASALAQSVITDRPPHSNSIDVFAKTVPAALAGGDFYVFGQTDGMIWFAVGDVAGKGLPAAMLMTRAVAACRVAFLAHRDASVAEVFARIEDELFDHLDEAGVFITMAVGVIDELAHSVSIANAGHSPVMIVHDADAECIGASVPPLGVVRHRIPKVATFTLGPDDCLVIGSDGLAEQSDPDGELFGYDRFRELCITEHATSSAILGDRVFAAVNEFAAGTTVSDDSTLVVLKVAGVE